MFDGIIEYFSKLENIVMVFVVGLVITGIIILNTVLRREALKNENSKIKFVRTRIVCSSISIIVIIILIAIILKMNGLNLNAYIAGLGIVTIIVAFALQDFLKDTISGLATLVENYFKVGDVILYEDDYYEVIDLSLKVTKLQNLKTKDVYTVSNHLIEEAKVISGRFLVIVPGHYQYDKDRMRDICYKISSEAKKNELIKGCKFVGVENFEASQIDYTLEVKTEPKSIEKAKRFMNNLIQDIFKEENIEIPYNQIDVHLDNIEK